MTFLNPEVYSKSKNAVNNSLYNMFLLKSSNPTTSDPEYFKGAEAQETDGETVCMSMTKVVKEEIN